MRAIRAAVVGLVLLAGGCTGGQPTPEPTPEPSPTRSGGRVVHAISVSLWHCGVDPVTIDGVTWEVVHPPFDDTNKPREWVGKGTASLDDPQALVYRDRSGITLRFTRDDGISPPPCI